MGSLYKPFLVSLRSWPPLLGVSACAALRLKLGISAERRHLTRCSGERQANFGRHRFFFGRFRLTTDVDQAIETTAERSPPELTGAGRAQSLWSDGSAQRQPNVSCRPGVASHRIWSRARANCRRWPANMSREEKLTRPALLDRDALKGLDTILADGLRHAWLGRRGG
jgi:hypothetical protein